MEMNKQTRKKERVCLTLAERLKLLRQLFNRDVRATLLIDDDSIKVLQVTLAEEYVSAGLEEEAGAVHLDKEAYDKLEKLNGKIEPISYFG